MTEDEFSQFEERKLNIGLDSFYEEVKDYEGLIEKVIRKEFDRDPDFQMKGMGRVIDLYSKFVLNIISECVMIEFKSQLVGLLTVDEYNSLGIDEKGFIDRKVLDVETLFIRLTIIKGTEWLQSFVKKENRLYDYLVAFLMYGIYTDNRKELLNTRKTFFTEFTAYGWMHDLGKNYFTQFFLNKEKIEIKTDFGISVLSTNDVFRLRQLIDSELLKYIAYTTVPD